MTIHDLDYMFGLWLGPLEDPTTILCFLSKAQGLEPALVDAVAVSPCEVEDGEECLLPVILPQADDQREDRRVHQELDQVWARSGGVVAHYSGQVGP